MKSGFVRFAYRPFDNRWLYWEKDTPPARSRRGPTYRHHAFEGNVWIEAREREAKEDFSRGTLVGDLADNFGNGLSSWFPLWLREDGLGSDEDRGRRENLTDRAKRYLECLGASAEDLFYHVLGAVHDPAYREGQRWRTAHRVATHPAAWMAARRFRGSRRRTHPLGCLWAEARRAS